MNTPLPAGGTRPLPSNRPPGTTSSGWRWLLALCLLLPYTGWSQARNYTFAASTGGTLASTTGATQLLANGNDDTPSTPVTSIGFSFVFEGITYTQFSVSPDGFMRLGGTAASSQFTNAIASTTNIPKLAPYWDDLATGTTGSVKYVLNGTSPNRSLVVEWFVTVPRNTAGAANGRFQAVLFETTNVIQYNYAALAAGSSYTVGLRGAETAQTGTGFLAVSTATNTAGTTASDSQLGAIPAGTQYTFTPPACNAPNNLVVSSITTTSASVAFTTNGATNYTVTTSPATTPQTVTTSPVSLSGLTAGTSYTVSIVSNCGATPSAASTVVFTTTANCSAPTALSIPNNTTGTTASLSFTNAANVTNYTVTTNPATNTYTVTSAPTSTPLPLTDLTPGTAYVVTVRSNCTAGVGGGQSAPVTISFTTPNPQLFTTARSATATYSSIASTGTSFVFTASPTNTDDNTSDAVTLPFAFSVSGIPATGFRLCTNGWITLNPATTSSSFSNALASTGQNRVLAPFWEDIVAAGNPGNSSANPNFATDGPIALANSFKYQTTGTMPNRVLTVEWINMETFNNAGPNLNFQVKLYETTNVIEYVYGTMSGFDGSTNYTYSYSLGLNGASPGGTGGFISQQTPNSNVFSTTTANNSLNLPPSCNSSVSFTPNTSFVTGSAPLVGVPANNEPAGALTLPVGAIVPSDFCAIFTSANATASAGIPVCSATTAGNPDDDVWFTFTLTGPTNTTVSLRPSGGYDGVLQVFSDAGITPLGCVNSAGPGLKEDYVNANLAAGTYYVRVYAATAGSGTNGAFVMNVFATPNAPANDNCAGAISLTATGTTCSAIAGSTVGATATAGAPSCSPTAIGTPDDDVWYSFTTGSTAVNDYNITLAGAAGFDGVIQLYSGTCAALTSIGCVNGTGTGGTESAVTNGLLASTTYYIRVYHAGAGSGSGNFTLCVFRSCNPPGSVAVTASGTGTANVTFTNGGSSSFTVTATPPSGPVVTGMGSTGATPGVALSNLVIGTTYSVVVQGNCSGTATSTPVNYTVPVAAPANDQCSGAIALTVNTPITGTTNGATTTGDPTGTCTTSITAQPGVFYSFVGNGQIMQVSTCSGPTGVSGGGDTKMFVYSGSCAALVCEGGNDDQSAVGGSCANTLASQVNFFAATGVTYYIFVQGFSSTLNFGINIVPAPTVVVNSANSPFPGSGAYNSIVVASGGTLNLTGNVTVAVGLTVQSGGTVNTLPSGTCNNVAGAGNVTVEAGATLNICDAAGITASGATGSIRNTGTRTFSTDASYSYNGTTAQNTGSGLPAQVRNLTVNNATGLTLSQATAVAQRVLLTSGSLASAGRLTLLSDATGTALVTNAGSGTVTGTSSMQRYIDPSLNAGLGYRHFSAPVAAQPFTGLATGGFAPNLNTAYNTSPTPYDISNFPNVFEYDEARVNTVMNAIPDAFGKGWKVPTTATMGVGKGYNLNISAADKITFAGTLNTGTLPVALARTGGPDGGWQLVGNPYPAPLDIALIAPADRTGLDAAFYVFRSTSLYNGFYDSYVNGIGALVAASGQGFFCRVSAGQAAGTLTFRNAQRQTGFNTVNPRFQRGPADARPQLRLTLAGTATGAAADQAYVYLQAGATAGFDAEYDAAKIANPTGLNLAALAGAEQLAISGLPLPTAATLVPLALGLPAAGSYVLTAADFANFGTTAVVLRDALTGTRTPLTAGTAYRFTAAGTTANGRFSLELNPSAAPLATAAQALAAQLGLYPNPAHESFTLTVPPVANTQQATATLSNALGQVMSTKELTLTAAGARAEFRTATLAPGIYALTLRIGNETVTRRVVVE